MASTAANDRDSPKDGDMPPVMTARKTGWRSIQIRQLDQQSDTKQGKKEPASPKAEENKEQPNQDTQQEEVKNEPSHEEKEQEEDVANNNTTGENNELSMVLSALRGTVAAAKDDNNEKKAHVEMLQEPESPRPSRNARADQIIAAAEAARDKAEHKGYQHMHHQPAEIHIPEPEEAVDVDSEPTTPVPAQFSPQEETTNDKHPDHQPHQQVHIELPADKNMADYITPPTPGTPPATNPMYSEELQDQPLEEEPSSSSPSTSSPTNEENKKGYQPNTLNPREQEQAGKDKDGTSILLGSDTNVVLDETMLKGIHAFFSNSFSEAEASFKSQANE